MLNRRRSLTAAAFGALLLTFPAAPLAAQATNTVGPPVLENFQLPGQRTTPPAPEPPVATTPPPAETTPPATETPRPEPRATTPAPARETPRPAPRAATEAPAPEPAPAPQAEAPATPAPEVLPPAQPGPLPVETPPPAAEAPDPGPSLTWLYFAAPAALGLLAFLLFTRRRRRARETGEELDYTAGPEAEAEVQAEEPAPVPAPQPAPAAPEPVPAAAGPRPWLEIDITPERAVATDTEAVVHYELILRNTGNAPARNIRIDTRLFNATEEAQMNAFFAGPIHEQSGSPHIAIEPGSGLFLVGQVALPKEQVHEVRVQDRTLFIPLVAMNVAYDWEGGSGGRTSKSWLVGREPQTPEAKMGAFRLDLGPRVYRSVAGREAKLVKV